MLKKMIEQLKTGQLDAFYKTYDEYVDLQTNLFQNFGHISGSHDFVVNQLLLTATEYVTDPELLLELFQQCKDANTKTKALMIALKKNRNDLVETFLATNVVIDDKNQKVINALPKAQQIRMAQYQLHRALTNPISLAERFSNKRRDAIRACMNNWAQLSPESLAQYVNKITLGETVNPFNEQQWSEFYQALMLVPTDCKAHLNVPKLNEYQYPQRASSSSSSTRLQSGHPLLISKAQELVQSLGVPSEKDGCSVEELAWYFANAGAPTPPEKVATKTACLNFLAKKSSKFDYYRTNLSKIVDGADDQDEQLSQQFCQACKKALLELQQGEKLDDWDLMTPSKNLKVMPAKVAEAKSLQTLWNYNVIKKWSPAILTNILKFTNQRALDDIELDINVRVYDGSYRNTAWEIAVKKGERGLFKLLAQSQRVPPDDFSLDTPRQCSDEEFAQLIPTMDMALRQLCFVRAAAAHQVSKMKILVEQGGVDINSVAKVNWEHTSAFIECLEYKKGLQYLLSFQNLDVDFNRLFVRAMEKRVEPAVINLFVEFADKKGIKIDWQKEFAELINARNSQKAAFIKRFIELSPVRLNVDFIDESYIRDWIGGCSYDIIYLLFYTFNIPFAKTEPFTSLKELSVEFKTDYERQMARMVITRIQIDKSLNNLDLLIPALFRPSFLINAKAIFEDLSYFDKRPQKNRIKAACELMGALNALESVFGNLSIKNHFVQALQLDAEFVVRYAEYLMAAKPESHIVFSKPNSTLKKTWDATEIEKRYLDPAKWNVWRKNLIEALAPYQHLDNVKALLNKLETFQHPETQKKILADVMPAPAKASQSSFFKSAAPKPIELSVESKQSIQNCVKQEFENNFSDVQWSAALLENLRVLINNPNVSEADFVTQQAKQIAARNFCEEHDSQINAYLDSPQTLHANGITPQQAKFALAYFRECMNEALERVAAALQNARVMQPEAAPPNYADVANDILNNAPEVPAQEPKEPEYGPRPPQHEPGADSEMDDNKASPVAPKQPG